MRIQKMLDDNIIPFRPRANGPDDKKPSPPLLNIPLVTKWLAALILFIHLGLSAAKYFFFPEAQNYAILVCGLIPASWTGGAPFFAWTPFTPVLYSLIHEGWMHLGINLLMLVAIGSGLERTIGKRDYLFIYGGGVIFAAAAHIAFSPFSSLPIIGASGGLSALFGAMLYKINQDNALSTGQRRAPILPIILVWIGISAIGGYLGAPNGSPVAWVAHIGGFIAGIGFMMMLGKTSKKD